VVGKEQQKNGSCKNISRITMNVGAMSVSLAATVRNHTRRKKTSLATRRVARHKKLERVRVLEPGVFL
jgi:hypothetical protein